MQAGGQDVTEKAEITDVLLKEGDGEYTVKISGVDLTGADAFNMMGISTDIPLKSADSIKVTDATLKIDGNEVEGAAGVELPHTKSYDKTVIAYSAIQVMTDGIFQAIFLSSRANLQQCLNPILRFHLR